MPMLHVVTQGRGPAVVLCHALGCDHRMWDETVAELAPGFSVLRYDQRGHGRSEVVPGPCSMEDLADDAAALIERRVAGPVHFVGLAMGGMVAQQLAVRHPHLVASIVVANSSSHFDDAARAAWRSRIDTVLAQGMAAVADAVIGRWFTPEFLGDPAGAARAGALRAVLERTDARAYAACCEAVSRIDFRTGNARVACPALVIAGTRDEATPRAMSVALCKQISGAELATLATAHLSAVENPVGFAGLVAGFIRRL